MNFRKNDIADPIATTFRWLSEHPIYLQWLQCHGLLWVKGKPGAGKSTLLRYAFETFKEMESSRESVIASYFFHGRGAAIQKNRRGLFQSLLHQILQRIPELLSSFSSIYKEKCDTQGEFGKMWDWQERDLQEYFKSHVASLAKIYPIRIYIDALDECGEEVAKSLVDFFQCMMSERDSTEYYLSICFSCRHYPLVSLDKGFEICVEDESHQDINIYIREKIESCIQEQATAETIQKEISGKSSGSFQWVVLVVLKICDLYKRGKSLAFIRKSIQGLPSELSRLYKELLEDISEEDLPQSLQLMQWICFAVKPLSLAELRFATVINADTPCESIAECQKMDEYAETDEQMEKKIRDLSKGLAEVKQHKDKWIAQFIHQSVSDYLIKDGLTMLDKPSSESVEGRAHFRLSRSCIRCMEMKELSNQIFEGPRLYRHVIFPFLRYAVTSWTIHMVKAEEEGLTQEHLLSFCQPQNRTLEVWIRLYSNIDRLSRHCPLPQTTLLHLASRYRIISVLNSILNLRWVDADSKDDWGRTPLSWAAGNGHKTVVQLLLEQNVEADSKDSRGQTPLFWAAQNGHVAVMQLLLECDNVEADSKDNEGQTPLFEAAQRGHEAVVQLLLEQNVEADSEDYLGRTPLSEAAWEGHMTVMQLLLEQNVKADLKDNDGQTPLFGAAKNGHEAVVQLLLEQNVEADSKDYTGQTPLIEAAQKGHEAVVQLLLEQNVEADSKDNQGRTSLCWAAQGGHRAVVQLLLEQNVEADSKDVNGRTPLYMAAQNGHEAVVQLLQSFIYSK